MSAGTPAVTVTDQVATIRFNRPDVGNALDLKTACTLRDAVREFSEQDLRAIVLTAEGPMFCAGGDVRAMAAAPDRPDFLAQLAGAMHDALIALRALPVPVLAAVQGNAAGAGIGLVLAADIAIASRGAKFVTAYPNIGLTPDCGVTALLPGAIGARRAALFALTDLTLDAATAAEWGLVTSICPDDELEACLAELVAAVTARPRQSVGQTARLLRRSVEREYADQLGDEGERIVRMCTTADADGLIRAFAAPKKLQTR